MRVNARALLIKNNTLGADPLVDTILSADDSAEKALYAKALELNKSALKRRYIEACLLASSDFQRISDILEIPADVIQMYAAVFYDVADLDKLSKLELLDVKDRDEHMMKLWALSQGLDFIEWRLGKAVNISPIDGLKELFTMSVFKAKESLFSGNSSESSKEGVKWSKMSMDIARLLKVWVMDSDAAKKDIELALAEVIPEFGSYADLNREEESLLDEAPEASETTEIPEFKGYTDLNQDNSAEK